MFLIKKKFLSKKLIDYYIENSKNHKEFESKTSGVVNKNIKNRKDISYSKKESFLLYDDLNKFFGIRLLTN